MSKQKGETDRLDEAENFSDRISRKVVWTTIAPVTGEGGYHQEEKCDDSQDAALFTGAHHSFNFRYVVME